MKEKVYVDRLFADYEDTPEIRDFKEEIAGNLKERVKELMSKGLGEEEAFEKATAELGDITAIADDIGKRKRNEAIGQMYIKAKVPITKRTAAGLTLATGLLLLGAGLGIINYFSEASEMLLYYISVFLVADAIGTYAFFGLTQETASRFPMKTKRALAYWIVLFVGVLGEGLAAVMFFFDGMELSTALGIEFAMVFPAVCALIFLIMTGTDRKKPWYKAMEGRGIELSLRLESETADPVKAARFGIASGALWVLTIALSITLYFVFDWPHAWIIPLFALAAQVLMAGVIFGRKSET